MPSSCVVKRHGANYTFPLSVAFAAYVLTNSLTGVNGFNCTFEVNETEEAQVGFLTPENGTEDFVACFLNFTGESHTLNIYFHEYYLTQTKVTVCRSDYIYFMEDLNEGNFEYHCESFYPTPSHFAKQFDEAVFFSISLPSLPKHREQPPEVFIDRPLFNITYDLRPKEMTPSISNPPTFNFLLFCNLNGVPMLYQTQDSYIYGCECRGSTYGDRCQWGGSCTNNKELELCYHGHCRHQGGQTMCICDSDYSGYHCEYHKDNLASTNDRTCGDQLSCEQKCQVFDDEPYCSCLFGYTLNGTQCISEDFVWDVTVKFLGPDGISFENQTRRYLQKKGIPKEMITLLQNKSLGELKVHFIANDMQNDELLRREIWHKTFNTTVYFEAQPRFTTVKLEQITLSDDALILRCMVIGSLPLLVKWYKDQHLIFLHNVTSCNQTSQIEYEYVIAKVSNDGSYSRTCMIELIIMNHDPLADYGPYTCEVTDSRFSVPKNSTLVNNLAAPLQPYISPKLTTVKMTGNLSLLCTTKGSWKGGDQYIMSWEVSPSYALEYYITQSQYWNGSRISLYNIKESLNLTCFIQEKYDRNIMVFRVTARVIVVSPGIMYCPVNSDILVSWPALPIGETIQAPCPDGFHGLCTLNCESSVNGHAVWTRADCSDCMYTPLLEIVKNPEVTMQGRGYPFAIQNANAIARTFLNILHNRKEAYLPDEIFGIYNALEKIVFAYHNPVSLYTFVGIVQHLTKYPCNMKCGWELYNIVRDFIKLSLKHRWHSQSVDEFQNIRALVKLDIVGNFSILVNISRGLSCGGVEVKISEIKDGSRKNSDTLSSVGVVTYSQPCLVLGNITNNIRKLGIGELPVILVDAPLVQTVGEISNMMKPTNEENDYVTNLTYNNHLTPTKELNIREREMFIWSRACGRVKFKIDGTFNWDFNPCSVIADGRAVKCLCKGQGLFGLFMRASTLPKLEMDQDDTRVVAVTCCTALLAILLLSVILLMRWSPSLNTKLPALIRRKGKQLSWQECPQTENSNENINYKNMASILSKDVVNYPGFEDLDLITSRSSSAVISSSTNSQLPNCHSHAVKNNTHIQVQAVINEKDNVYMDMNPNTEETRVNTLQIMNEEHDYVNVADVCTTERLAIEADCVEGDNWVLSAKGSQSTYLPMTGMTASF